MPVIQVCDTFIYLLCFQCLYINVQMTNKGYGQMNKLFQDKVVPSNFVNDCLFVFVRLLAISSKSKNT